MASNRKPETHVALLRGINVGGKNKLPMKTLAGLFEAAGCADVRTYIQSGNVVYRASAAVAKRAPDLVARSLVEELGLAVPVVARTAAELRRVEAGNPFLAEGADPKQLHVAFLVKKPTAAQVLALDPDRSPPDRFVVIGREIYLSCPNGMARTKLTNAYLDRALGTTTTVRNWNTVRALVGMLSE